MRTGAAMAKILVATDGSRVGRAAVRFALAAAARQFRKRGLRRQVRYIVPKDPAPVATAILREANRIDADLIVVGSQGHGALRRWMLGSVATRLMHAAERPVTVVHLPRSSR